MNYEIHSKENYEKFRKIPLYSIAITYKCNWFCNYCLVQTHLRPEPTFDEIKEKIQSIPDNVRVTLSGGEPGTQSKEIVKYIFDELQRKQCIIEINTNGLFFEKFPEWENSVYRYFYHCSEKLEGNIKLPPKHLYHKIDFMITLTDELFPRLEKFINYWLTLEINKKIFIYGGVELYQFKGTHPILSKKNAFKVLRLYKSIMDKESYEYMYRSSLSINQDKGTTFL